MDWIENVGGGKREEGEGEAGCAYVKVGEKKECQGGWTPGTCVRELYGRQVHAKERNAKKRLSVASDRMPEFIMSQGGYVCITASMKVAKTGVGVGKGYSQTNRQEDAPPSCLVVKTFQFLSRAPPPT